MARTTSPILRSDREPLLLGKIWTILTAWSAASSRTPRNGRRGRSFPANVDEDHSPRSARAMRQILANFTFPPRAKALGCRPVHANQAFESIECYFRPTPLGDAGPSSFALFFRVSEVSLPGLNATQASRRGKNLLSSTRLVAFGERIAPGAGTVEAGSQASTDRPRSRRQVWRRDWAMAL